MVRKPLTSNWWWIFPRAIILVGIFLLLHYVHDWFPTSTFALIIGADGEAIFQHWKIASFSFIILTLIEIPLSIGELKHDWWWFGKIFSIVFVPFVIFILFYVLLMFLNSPPSEIVEIINANIVLLLSYFTSSILEWQFREKKVQLGVKIVLLVLLVILIAEFIVFSFKTPIYDIFLDPWA